MNWINLRTESLRSSEFAGADSAAIGTWLRVTAYCCEQENDGQIADAVAWNDRQWMRVAGVTMAEVEAAKPLIYNDGVDCFCHDYPAEKQAEVQAKRKAGRKGGKSRAKRFASSSAPSSASSSASTEGEGEGEMEGEREQEVEKKREIICRNANASRGATAPNKPLTTSPSENGSVPPATTTATIDPDDIPEPVCEEDELQPALLPRAGEVSPKKKAHGTQQELEAFAKEIGLPTSDGETMFWKFESNGWKNGRNPVKDWRATMRQWKAAGYHPSQNKKSPNGQPQRTGPAQMSY